MQTMDHGSALWRKLERFGIGPASAGLTFSRRLARENGWSQAFAERVIVEYKKFIYLIALHRLELTPSDEVDQAWHLHMTYTRSYWQGLCRNILGFELHHNPTRGGQQQARHFRQQYANTLRLYQDTFGQAAPKDIWPPVDKRFRHADQFVRLNRARHWILGKPPLTIPTLLIIAVSPLALVACGPEEGESAFWYWAKIGIGIAGALYLVRLLDKWLGGSGGGGGGGMGGGCSGAGCGGCGGCGGS
jgi:hypothetical protein